MTCPCGWKFIVPRFCFGIDIYDNKTKRDAVSNSFMTDSPAACAEALERAARQMRRLL